MLLCVHVCLLTILSPLKVKASFREEASRDPRVHHGSAEIEQVPRAAEAIKEVTFMLGSARLSEKKEKKGQKKNPIRLDTGRMLKKITEKRESFYGGMKKIKKNYKSKRLKFSGFQYSHKLRYKHIRS